MIHIFPDTNTLLHFERWDQIDWHSLANADHQTPIKLVVAPIILRELEHQKLHNQNLKLRERAASSSRWLADMAETTSANTLQGITNLEFYSVDPVEEDFQGGLSRLVNDDWFVATVCRYAKDKGAALESVMIVSADLPLRVKFRAKSIAAVPPADRNRLPIAPDANQEEIRSLRAQLAAERSRRPRLVVSFDDGNELLSIRKPQSIQSMEQYVDQEMAKVLAQHPLRPRPGPISFPSQGSKATPKELENLESVIKNIVVVGSDLHEARVTKYNQMLQSYYAAHKKYLESFWESAAQLNRSFTIVFKLSNEGTAAASDIDVRISVPEGVSMSLGLDEPEKLEAPTPPKMPPLVRFGSEQDYFDGAIGIVTPIPIKLPRITSMSAPARIEVSDDARSVHLWLRNLKHLREWRFETLTATFDGSESPRGFAISYEVHSMEMPSAVAGILNVRVA